MPNKFERIFVHYSESEYGHALMINEWHILKKFKCIGYNLVIQNGYPTNDWFKNKTIIPFLEGAIEIGRMIDTDQWFEPFEEGAGVKGWNKKVSDLDIARRAESSLSDRGIPIGQRQKLLSVSSVSQPAP